MSDRLEVKSVHEFTSRDGEVKKVYTRLGSAFPFKNGKGYMVKMTAMPAPVDGEYVLILAPPYDKESEGKGSTRSRPEQDAPMGDDFEDTVPF